MSDVVLLARALDYGLEELNQYADKLYVCSQQPTTYAEATSTYALGMKDFGVGLVFGSPADATPDGRHVISTTISDSLISTAGTVAAWAAVDSVNSRLLATGILTGGMAVRSGQGFTLGTLTVRLTASPAVPPLQALINGLTSDGIFVKLDRLWIFAQPTEAVALVDLVTTTATATAVNSPTFTANDGYTFDGTTNYLDTGWAPNTGVNYTLNSAHIGAWVTTPATGPHAGSVDGGGGTQCLITNNGTIWRGAVNDPLLNFSVGTAGHVLAVRTGANDAANYINGVSDITSSAAASTGRNAFNVAVGARAFAGPPFDFAAALIAAVHVGAQLSSTEAGNFYTRLRTYMTAVGVP